MSGHVDGDDLIAHHFAHLSEFRATVEAVRLVRDLKAALVLAAPGRPPSELQELAADTVATSYALAVQLRAGGKPDADTGRTEEVFPCFRERR